MNIGKGAVIGAALLASLAFVAGCKGSEPTPSGGTNTTTTAPAKPASEELTDAIKKLNSTSYSYSMKFGPGEMTGAVDPAKKAVKMALRIAEAGQSFSMDIMLVGTDMYMKLDGMPLPGLTPGKYLHLDATKVKSLTKLGVEDLSDPTQSAKLTQSLIDVERTGTGTFKGTIDMTKVEQEDEDIAALGDKAKAVPFEATVDSEGRVSSMTIALPAGASTPAMDIEMKYFDFGSATTIAKPAASEVVEADAAMYEMFNG